MYFSFASITTILIFYFHTKQTLWNAIRKKDFPYREKAYFYLKKLMPLKRFIVIMWQVILVIFLLFLSGRKELASELFFHFETFLFLILLYMLFLDLGILSQIWHKKKNTNK